MNWKPIDLGFYSTPIDLGIGKGFIVDLGMPKMEPCIPDMKQKEVKKDDNNSLLFGLGDFANDMSKTVHNTKEDYDNLKKSAQLMKSDLIPVMSKLKKGVKTLITKIRKTKVK